MLSCVLRAHRRLLDLRRLELPTRAHRLVVSSYWPSRCPSSHHFPWCCCHVSKSFALGIIGLIITVTTRVHEFTKSPDTCSHAHRRQRAVVASETLSSLAASCFLVVTRVPLAPALDLLAWQALSDTSLRRSRVPSVSASWMVITSLSSRRRLPTSATTLCQVTSSSN